MSAQLMNGAAQYSTWAYLLISTENAEGIPAENEHLRDTAFQHTWDATRTSRASETSPKKAALSLQFGPGSASVEAGHTTEEGNELTSHVSRLTKSELNEHRFRRAVLLERFLMNDPATLILSKQVAYPAEAWRDLVARFRNTAEKNFDFADWGFFLKRAEDYQGVLVDNELQRLLFARDASAPRPPRNAILETRSLKFAEVPGGSDNITFEGKLVLGALNCQGTRSVAVVGCSRRAELTENGMVVLSSQQVVDDVTISGRILSCSAGSLTVLPYLIR